jgi:hypothetical protein
MESIEALPQKIVDQKIVILKSRLDSAKAQLLGEENKTKFFVKLGFLKPKPSEIRLVDSSKFYEPYIVIGGRYSIDYCKKHLFEFKADSEVKKMFVGGEEVRVEPFDPAKPNRMLKLVGEEHCHYVNETFLVVDKRKRELPPEKVHLAPFEDSLENVDNADLRKANISVEEEIQFIRSKIVKRPLNADFVIKEVFEINDRMILYNPIYELVFQEVKTSQIITLLIDGVTGKFTVAKLISTKSNRKIDSSAEKAFEPPKDSRNSIQTNKTSYFEDPADQKVETQKIEQNIIADKGKNTIDLPTADFRFEPENATVLACNLLKRLGFKDKISPMKVLPEGDCYMVEVSLQDRLAKVLVNTKTKEVKEYDIQESSSF